MVERMARMKSKEYMTPKERVCRRIKGQEVDRAPNACIIMGFAPTYTGKKMRDFYLDYRVFVESNIKVNQDFDIDIMSAISDPYREAYDLGALVEFPEDDIPLCKEPLLTTLNEMDKIKKFNPYDSVRIKDRIDAVKLFKKEVGEDYSIMGWVECPFAEAADLRGVNNIMLDLYDEPKLVKQLLELCLEIEIECAKAQIEAGADIIGMGDAAASLIGQDLYDEFAFSYEKRLIDAVHAHGAIARLHICGNITSILKKARHTGADIIDLDSMVDFKTSSDILEGYSVPCGNINPVAIIKNGTPMEITQAVYDLLDINNTHSFIMGGCEIPIGTPEENLKSITKALKTYDFR